MARRLDVLLLALAAFLLLTLAVQRCGRGPAISPARASWTMTPGVLNPEVTETTIRSTICRHGWTRTIRPPTTYTNTLKLKQMRAYGREGGLSAYQEDHLISLELGGHPTDPRNLWPEPYPRAAKVDRIENELNAKVCSGGLSLSEAQRRESMLKHTSG